MKFSAVSLLTSDPVDSFLEVTKRSYLLDTSHFFHYLCYLMYIKIVKQLHIWLLILTAKMLLQMIFNISVTKQTNKPKHIYIKIKFQNSTERFEFLCRKTVIKIVWINPWTVIQRSILGLLVLNLY